MAKHKSTKFQCEKLVRDKTIERNMIRNLKPEYRILDEQEYLQALFNKLKEETEEVCSSNSKDELEGEIADILEVLDAIIIANNLSRNAIEKEKISKHLNRGGFTKKIYVKSMEISTDIPEYAHFSSQPEKYPVIS